MAGNFVSNNCRLVCTHLTGTTNTTIFTASGYVQVIGVVLANVTANPVVVTASIFSAADNDQYRLLYQHSVPANGSVALPLEAFALNEDDEIRVQAGSGNAIDVVMSIAEVPGRSG